ncbi:MAG TPA: Uma2 family endonuclease [Micromonosporaceae bacterium]|nr:Uma2 family endonuclease [Micromonosporaceae bacterium]
MGLDTLVRLPARPLTLDDVAEIAANSPDLRYELHRGMLLVMPPADGEHAAIVTRMTVWLVMNGFGASEVLGSAGVRVSREGGGTGRVPDLIVLHKSSASNAVWFDPADISLAIEVVSNGSEDLDRLIKPVEYAAAGIPNFWRVERAAGSEPTVHAYRLGVDENGNPAYVGHLVTPLNDLLAGPVPTLG